MKKILSIYLLGLIGFGNIANATVLTFNQSIQEESLSAKKKSSLKLYMTAKEANEIINLDKDNTLFLDIRTKAEIAYVGSPENVDGMVPYMEHDSFMIWDQKEKRFTLDLNPEFINGVKYFLSNKKLSKDSMVILICRSGDRSAKAADLLSKAGFTNVYSIAEGFEGDMSKAGRRDVNGWKNSNLPWTYTVNKDKLYSN